MKLVGQNPEVVNATRMTGKILFPIAFIVQSTPAWLRPAVGKLCQLWGRYHWKILMQDATPAIEQALKDPDDAMTQKTLLGRYVQEVGRMTDGRRLLTLNYLRNLVGMISLTGVGGTAVGCAEVLLNILSYPDYQILVKEIRAEARQLFAGDITKNALDAMSITDSICRESLRLESGDDFSVQGVATVPLTTKDGSLLPKGTRIALPLYALHRNPELYPGDTLAFDPYRFCKDHDRRQALAHDASDQYLPFAMGTHACPGRWFAMAMIKIIIATLLVEYDVLPLRARPTTPRIGGYMVPPSWTKVWLRKRKERADQLLNHVETS